MSLPTGDGDDIEDVVVQVGLDGVKTFAVGDQTVARRAFDLPNVSAWSLKDPTILTVHAKDGGGEVVLSLSADVETISAMVDVLTTSAFQWCELNGLDAMDTIVSTGTEWKNLRAGTTNGGMAAMSPSSSVSVVGIQFWDSPEYSGWLTKQGEMLKTWRKRWFVLKDGYLVWYKTNIVDARAVTRGQIPLSTIDNVSIASEAAAGRRFAILVDGALPAKLGTRYLVADSERERTQWIEALQKGMRERSTVLSTGSSPAAELLRQGYAQVTTPTPAHHSPAPVPTPAQQFAEPSNIQIEFQGYASATPAAPKAQSQTPSPGASYVTLPPLPFAHPSSAAGSASFAAPPAAPVSSDYSYPTSSYSQSQVDDWTTYHTPEGKPYYYNSKTGETSWERPRS